ncbi:hypothetical protein DPMN_019768 [Dreissena polymorpha]|uniref:DNA 3'-5' helicase n=1 Tax=Dreissena polymorpha TaxID=45954 RepID=A0A9D4S9L2_DREPO|nr:hypothetical protein DPMN_019768 [Dreissena polymorpha]
MGLNKNSEVNPTEPCSHKPYMDRSLVGCLAGHYNAIGTEVDHFHLNKLEFNSCCSLDNYSSRSHFHKDMMEFCYHYSLDYYSNQSMGEDFRPEFRQIGELRSLTDVPLLAVTASATEKVCLWSWLVIQLGDTSYNGEHRSYNRVVEMFTSSTTDATKGRILNDFRAGRVRVVVATVAFGLGTFTETSVNTDPEHLAELSFIRCANNWCNALAHSDTLIREIAN